MTRRTAPAPAPTTAPRWQFVPDEGGQPTGERTSSVGIVAFTLMVFVLVYALIFAIGWAVAGTILPPLFFVALAGAVLVAMGVHIAQQWERVVVLRLGKFNRVSGPGLFWTIPFVEQNTARIDCRVRATTFDAKETLTSDLVPLDVNAVLLWMVYDAKAACTECSDFSRTVELAAQAALRDAIGCRRPRWPSAASSWTPTSRRLWRTRRPSGDCRCCR